MWFLIQRLVAWFYSRFWYLPTEKGRQAAMCVEPQPPIQRFFNVPDLVGNVFERLDPDSRRAFFQSDPLVAGAGPVLAQSELRVELSPTKSLEDQWQRVLRLTRGQPLRCLIVAGHSKEQLLNFLRCVPQGRQEEQQKVLQGTELRLQVLVKLETGGISQLRSFLSSWYTEQQQVEEGTPEWLVLDLCGRELETESNLEPTSRCTLRNGTLHLHRSSRVRVAADHVCFESLTLKGESWTVVEVVRGGSLQMEGCCVEGGRGDAVRVVGSNSRLCAKRCALHSKESSGLEVRHGGRAVLHQCSASNNGRFGVHVAFEGSMLQAANCHMDGNVDSNIWVYGGQASIKQVSSNCSKVMSGWEVGGQGSIVATDSEASKNAYNGAQVWGERSSITLVRCKNNGNVYSGWCAGSGSSLVVESSHAKINRRGDRKEYNGGRITCRDHLLGQRGENSMHTGRQRMQRTSYCALQ